jgi:glycosyltransferase involved in cell wall biosynthesis
MEKLARNREVFCVTNREYGGPSQYEQNNIRYYTVKPRLVYRLESRIAHAAPHKRLLGKLIPLINKPKLLLTVGIWPLISPTYANRIYRQAIRLCKEEKINCIVPVYTQIDTLIAAKRVKKKLKKIRIVPYFLDSLSGGYGPRYFTREQICRRGLKWESKLLPWADQIIVMESSRAHHETYSTNAPYFDKLRYFDLPLLRTEPVEPGEPLMDPEKRNMVYVGTLPGGIRSPEYVLEVFRHLQGDEWQLWFIGSSGCAALNTAADSDDRIHVVGRVPHELALRYEAQAHMLINIGNTNPYMTPSKIFEYMSFGKPILSTMAVTGEPSRSYLERYPEALILDERTDAPVCAAQRLEDFAKEAHPVDMGQVLDRFYYNTPDAFADFLEHSE